MMRWPTDGSGPVYIAMDPGGLLPDAEPLPVPPPCDHRRPKCWCGDCLDSSNGHMGCHDESYEDPAG